MTITPKKLIERQNKMTNKEIIETEAAEVQDASQVTTTPKPRKMSNKTLNGLNAKIRGKQKRVNTLAVKAKGLRTIISSGKVIMHKSGKPVGTRVLEQHEKFMYRTKLNEIDTELVQAKYELRELQEKAKLQGKIRRDGSRQQLRETKDLVRAKRAKPKMIEAVRIKLQGDVKNGDYSKIEVIRKQFPQGKVSEQFSQELEDLLHDTDEKHYAPIAASSVVDSQVKNEVVEYILGLDTTQNNQPAASTEESNNA